MQQLSKKKDNVKVRHHFFQEREEEPDELPRDEDEDSDRASRDNEDDDLDEEEDENEEAFDDSDAETIVLRPKKENDDDVDIDIDDDVEIEDDNVDVDDDDDDDDDLAMEVKKNSVEEGNYLLDMEDEEEEDDVEVDVDDYDNEMEVDDEEEEDESCYLQKFQKTSAKNVVLDCHPECNLPNFTEIQALATVVRDTNNRIIDPLHQTLDILTKYERAKILGLRAQQIETGSLPLVHVPKDTIDCYLIAEMELKEKKIPFIIRRPLSNNSFEYWHVRDLQNILF